MKIHAISLECIDAEEQLEFYGNTLGLEGQLIDNEAHIQVGESKIIFKTSLHSHMGAYHFAMNIPRNKFDEAVEWLEERSALLSDKNGEVIFNFTKWDAHSIYTYDPSGNIIELIARHGLNNDTDEEFSSQHILNISEIGLATNNVLATSKALQDQYQLPLYKQDPDENFTPLGDENGLFIVVKNGREWFPDTEIPSEILPLQIEFETEAGDFIISLPSLTI